MFKKQILCVFALMAVAGAAYAEEATVTQAGNGQQEYKALQTQLKEMQQQLQQIHDIQSAQQAKEKQAQEAWEAQQKKSAEPLSREEQIKQINDEINKLEVEMVSRNEELRDLRRTNALRAGEKRDRRISTENELAETAKRIKELKAKRDSL